MTLPLSCRALEVTADTLSVFVTYLLTYTLYYMDELLGEAASSAKIERDYCIILCMKHICTVSQQMPILMSTITFMNCY